MVAFHELPILRARQVIRALERAGFIQHRQKGSHIVMKHPMTKACTVVPDHRGETISKGLLTRIIERAGISIEYFLTLL